MYKKVENRACYSHSKIKFVIFKFDFLNLIQNHDSFLNQFSIFFSKQTLFFEYFFQVTAKLRRRYRVPMNLLPQHTHTLPTANISIQSDLFVTIIGYNWFLHVDILYICQYIYTCILNFWGASVKFVFNFIDKFHLFVADIQEIDWLLYFNLVSYILGITASLSQVSFCQLVWISSVNNQVISE